MSSAATFSKGTRLWIDGRAATILASEAPHAAEVVFDGAEAPEAIDLLSRYAAGDVQWTAPTQTPTETPAALEHITESAWNEARRREAMLREVLDAPEVEKAIHALRERTGTSRATLYRWKADYARDGLRGLVPDTARRGAPGKTRLDAERETFLADALRRLYLRRTRPTLRHAFALLVAEFREKKIPPPALHTVRAVTAIENGPGDAHENGPTVPLTLHA